MYADSKPIMVAVPADYKVDFKRFKVEFKVKDLRMATADEVQKITLVPIGAVPPFGEIFGISLYVDKSVKENKTIVFNAGMHTRSISLTESDYEKAAKPIFGDYSQRNG